MKVTSQNLRHFRDEQSLVSIGRDRFDDRSIQAFVLHFSKLLVLLRHVYDFHLDGLMLLRIQDITSIKTTATDGFQKRLLIEEDLFDNVGFEHHPPIGSYDKFLSSLPKDQIVILEDEIAEDPDFIIGTVIAVDKQAASIRSFTGAAHWEDAPSRIEIDRVTSCQTDTNYTNFYARHFSRRGTP